MELGETLIITATITSNTYLATRSKNNSEVIIRISPPGGSPSTPKRNTPRSPQPSLFITSTKSSSTTMPTQLDLDNQLPVPHDAAMIQGWAMVATQPQTSWDIAWVCTTTLPVPKISVMLESELSIKPCVPSQFEEIESINEIETLPITGMDRTEPLKFEIKTKASNTYKIIANNFMTNGLRRLMTTLTSSIILPLPNSDFKQLESSNRKSLPRVSTPKPPKPTNNAEKSLSQLSLNDSNHTPKPMLGRTSTIIPDVAQPAPALPLSQVAKFTSQQRSASCDIIPPIPNFKPAPRPVSLNVYDLIKNYDSPKSNDPRSFLKMHSTRSRLAPKPTPRPIAFVPSVTHVASKLRMIEKCDEASDFSDCDDGASNFSEDMDENSLKESPMYRQKKRNAVNVLNCSDAEIRDLCERTKGLSPDINFILQQEPYCDSDSDDSSCFSEDDEDPKEEAQISDSFSDCSAVSSNISGSGIFDSIAVGRSDPGIRRLHKAEMKKSESTMSMRKTIKAEKVEKRKKEKEAKAARTSKKIEKKREHKDEKHKEEKHKEDKHKEEKHKDEKNKEEKHKEEKHKEEKHKEEKNKDEAHKEEKHMDGDKKKTLNVRVKSWLRIFGRIGTPTECS